MKKEKRSVYTAKEYLLNNSLSIVMSNSWNNEDDIIRWCKNNLKENRCVFMWQKINLNYGTATIYLRSGEKVEFYQMTEREYDNLWQLCEEKYSIRDEIEAAIKANNIEGPSLELIERLLTENDELAEALRDAEQETRDETGRLENENKELQRQFDENENLDSIDSEVLIQLLAKRHGYGTVNDCSKIAELLHGLNGTKDSVIINFIL